MRTRLDVIAVGGLLFLALGILIRPAAKSDAAPPAGTSTVSETPERTPDSESRRLRDGAHADGLEASEFAPGLLSASERIVGAWSGNPEVDSYTAALADAWRIGPIEFAPRARHVALYAPCVLVAPEQLPTEAGYSVEWEGPLDAEWKVTRGLGGHAESCAFDVTQKPEAVKVAELAGRRFVAPSP